MWKIETSGGLGQIWQTPKIWEEDKGKDEEEPLVLRSLHDFNCSFFKLQPFSRTTFCKFKSDNILYFC